MNVGACRSDDDPIVVIKQQEAVQPIGPGLHREKGAVGDDKGRRRPLRVEREVAICPIYSAGGREMIVASRGYTSAPAWRRFFAGALSPGRSNELLRLIVAECCR
jgi:hypothetical protein